MAHKPRPRPAPSANEILMASHPTSGGAGRGRSKPVQRGGSGLQKQVHGEVADPIVLDELRALQKQRGGQGNWHVLGADKKLDDAIMSAGDASLSWVKDGMPGGGVALAQPSPGAVATAMDEDEELNRLKAEIEALENAQKIMYAADPQQAVSNIAAKVQHSNGQGAAPPAQFSGIMDQGYPPAAGMGLAGARGQGHLSVETHDPTSMYAGQTPQYSGQTPQYSGQTPQYPGQTPQYPGAGATPSLDRPSDRELAAAKRQEYKAELDAQIRMKTGINQGRMERQAGSGNSNPAAPSRGGVQYDDGDRQDRQRKYKAELDKQVQEKMMQTARNQGHIPQPPLSPQRSVNADSGPNDNFNSPDLKAAANKVHTMHWGEREVNQWHETEKKRKEYKEDLLRQMREKEAAKSRDGSQPSTARSRLSNIPRDHQQLSSSGPADPYGNYSGGPPGHLHGGPPAPHHASPYAHHPNQPPNYSGTHGEYFNQQVPQMPPDMDLSSDDKRVLLARRRESEGHFIHEGLGRPGGGAPMPGRSAVGSPSTSEMHGYLGHPSQRGGGSHPGMPHQAYGGPGAPPQGHGPPDSHHQYYGGAVSAPHAHEVPGLHAGPDTFGAAPPSTYSPSVVGSHFSGKAVSEEAYEVMVSQMQQMQAQIDSQNALIASLAEGKANSAGSARKPIAGRRAGKPGAGPAGVAANSSKPGGPGARVAKTGRRAQN